MKPKAFLSYRHNFVPEVAGKKALIQAVDAQGKLALVFDKSVTEVGDSVTAFMEELITARCVFLFISEDYFKSAYTLFELIAIHQHEEAAKKIILPVCLSEEMLGVYDYTNIEAHWNNSQPTQDVLATLLRISGRASDIPSSAQMLEQIRRAWEGIVFPYLNTLRDADAPYDMGVLIDDVVSRSSQQAEVECGQISTQHRALITEEVAFLLDDQPQIRESLVRASRPLKRLGAVNNTVFAEHFLSDTGEATRALGDLTNAAGKIRDALGRESTAWRELFQDIEQLCGCLLLNTIDPVWWFNHELELRRQAVHCVTGSGYVLDHPSFVEVIVSKELLARDEWSTPKFTHDPSGTGGVVPSGGVAENDYNNMMMFDATDSNAIAQNLLGDIHNDLLRSAITPSDADQLMREIRDRAESIKNASSQRPVYYIVGHNYLQQLQSQPWFSTFEHLLKGSLQFICCSQETMSNTGRATKESQTQLLSAVGLLLNLNRD